MIGALTKKIADTNVWVIYGAILLLGIAYGVSIAVLAIHLDAHGIPKLGMGGLAAAFAAGIAVFALPAGHIVSRFGAKKTLIAALAAYAMCVAAFPFLSTLPALAVARFFDGASSVTIWVAAETALLSRSNATNKAFVMSLYAISLAVGYVLGPILATGVVRIGGTAATFLTAGLLACGAASVIVTGLERDARAAHEAASSGSGASAASIFWRTKTSCAATFTYGYFQASVVLFLPLFLIRERGVSEEETILTTAFFAAGMLAASAKVGKLGDSHGHLLVMRVLATIGGTMVASFVLLRWFPAMCVAVFVAGATLASISPVSLALQGVVTRKEDLGRANSFYNAAYAVGMLVGPPISSVIFTKWGGGPMLLHFAALWGVFACVTLVFAADDPRAQARLSDPLLRSGPSRTPESPAEPTA